MPKKQANNGWCSQSWWNAEVAPALTPVAPPRETGKARAQQCFFVREVGHGWQCLGCEECMDDMTFVLGLCQIGTWHRGCGGTMSSKTDIAVHARTEK